MENASKALIMAGSILMALIIIGALVLMFNNLSAYQESNSQNTRDTKIVEFNNQYTTYNRTNVRGSDLYSLFNKVIDYNRRQTPLGSTGSDRGQYLGYMPMTVTVYMKNRNKDFSADADKVRLITESSYTQSNNVNEFSRLIDSKVKSIETDLRRSSNSTKIGYSNRRVI